jgi:hypothetical protein
LQRKCGQRFFGDVEDLDQIDLRGSPSRKEAGIDGPFFGPAREQLGLVEGQLLLEVRRPVAGRNRKGE